MKRNKSIYLTIKEDLKEKIANGTYNVDAKLTAQSIMDSIKEGRKINDK